MNFRTIVVDTIFSHVSSLLKKKNPTEFKKVFQIKKKLQINFPKFFLSHNVIKFTNIYQIIIIISITNQAFEIQLKLFEISY